MDLFSGIVKTKLSSNLTGMRFPVIVESVIYRIIKELVNNTIKHAKASMIFVNLDYFDLALVCHYHDDGIGFDWQQQFNSQAKGMGISNIMSRIRSLGGNFEIQADPGQGFDISIVIKSSPIDANSK
jgi:signal transduction histidine kinase